MPAVNSFRKNSLLFSFTPSKFWLLSHAHLCPRPGWFLLSQGVFCSSYSSVVSLSKTPSVQNVSSSLVRSLHSRSTHLKTLENSRKAVNSSLPPHSGSSFPATCQSPIHHSIFWKNSVNVESRTVSRVNLPVTTWLGKRIPSISGSVKCFPELTPAVRRLRQLARRVQDEDIEDEVQEVVVQASQSSFPEATWRRKLQSLLDSPSTPELVLREKDQRKHFNNLQALSRRMGLYCYEYEKVVVVSIDPLPHYRPDLDLRRPQRQITILENVRREVENMVGSYRGTRPTFANFQEQEQTDRPLSRVLSEAYSAQGKGWKERDAPMGKDARDRKSERMLTKQNVWQASDEGKKMLEVRKNLPAHKERDYLLSTMANNQVLVVSGETGCGKTTQLPQFILEDEIAKGRGGECSIICTQPRRISAISVAERVAAERGEEIGDSIGYQVRLEGRKSRNTALLFCTTGILLRKLTTDPLLTGVTHVVVDEIHERGMNEDFLLIVLNDLLSRRPDLKLVLMSATLNAELFSEYFGGAPTTHIPGFTHPVRSFFLEQILEITGHTLTPFNQIDDYGPDKMWRRAKQVQAMNRRKRNHLTSVTEDALYGVRYDQFSRDTQESLANWTGENIGFNLIEAVLSHIVSNEPPGAVLVFLTGWEDIHALLNQMRQNPVLGNSDKVLLLGCHGAMSSPEQKLIFNPAPPGVRKIVLATNMAETSITINDCVYVVDVGKAKETSYDALNNTPCLLPTWVSRASARQRRGRAGRVKPGVCFHLYPKAVHDALPEFTLPELLRTPLHSLCLQIKSLQLGGIASFLSKALQAPEPLAVQNAIELLEDVGALEKNEELTALGRHLTQLPLEPRVGKMLCMGAVLNCLDPILTVAAGLAERDPWVMPADKKEMALGARYYFAGEDCSDHIALVRAYDGWTKAVKEGRERERDYVSQSFVSRQTLQAMSGLRRAFLKTLGELGLVDMHNGLGMANQYSNDPEVVKAIILAGLFPSVASAVKKNRSTVFKTREDGSVNLHPNSVTSKHPRFPYPWLAFNEKVKTSSVFIRDATGVTDTALLLFGGRLEKGAESGYLHMQNRHLEFFMSPDAARTIMMVRSELESLVQRKLEDPSVDIHRDGKPVIEAVMTLLHSDKGQGSFVFGRNAQVPKTQQHVSKASHVEEDKKSLLCNYCKKYQCGRPRFRVEEMGPSHSPLFRGIVILGGKTPRSFYGKPCSTKKKAEMSAAGVAWDKLIGAPTVSHSSSSARSSSSSSSSKLPKEREGEVRESGRGGERMNGGGKDEVVKEVERASNQEQRREGSGRRHEMRGSVSEVGKDREDSRGEGRRRVSRGEERWDEGGEEVVGGSLPSSQRLGRRRRSERAPGGGEGSRNDEEKEWEGRTVQADSKNWENDGREDSWGEEGGEREERVKVERSSQRPERRGKRAGGDAGPGSTSIFQSGMGKSIFAEGEGENGRRWATQSNQR